MQQPDRCEVLVLDNERLKVTIDSPHGFSHFKAPKKVTFLGLESKVTFERSW